MTDPQQPGPSPQQPASGAGPTPASSQQPYAGQQPPYPGAPRGQQPYGYPQAAYGYPASQPSGGARSGLSWTAIIIGLAMLLVSPVLNAMLQFLMVDQVITPPTYTVIQLIFGGVLRGLIAAAALVLGIIAARGPAKMLAGMAIGLNAAIVIGIVFGYVGQALTVGLY